MVLKVTLIGLVAGVVGTGLGGVASALFYKKAEKFIKFSMGLSGGIMLAVVVFDLMKESMDHMGVIKTAIWILVGVILTMILKSRLHLEEDMKSGYLIFLSIMMHNLPEGLAIGSSFMSTEQLGIAIALVIGIHNIPEGLAMALGLMGNKMKLGKIILMTVIAGTPMALGSFLGVYFASIFSSLVGIFIALAGGTMIYVVLEELFPKAKSIYSVIGFLIGMLIVSFI